MRGAQALIIVRHQCSPRLDQVLGTSPLDSSILNSFCHRLRSAGESTQRILEICLARAHFVPPPALLAPVFFGEQYRYCGALSSNDRYCTTFTLTLKYIQIPVAITHPGNRFLSSADAVLSFCLYWPVFATLRMHNYRHHCPHSVVRHRRGRVFVLVKTSHHRAHDARAGQH